MVAHRRPGVEISVGAPTSDVEAGAALHPCETARVSSRDKTRMIRAARQRPPWHQVLRRTIAVTLITAFALSLLAIILPGFSIDSRWDAVLAGFVIGIANAVVWPALAFLVVPLSVVTLGLGAIVLNAIFVGWVLELLPGIEISGFWPSLAIVIGLVIVSTAISSVLALDDEAWTDQRASELARKRANEANITDVPGVVFVQLDGVAYGVLRRALRSG